VINGLGLGNSTRCHAVIERLAEAGMRIHVLTSGNGLEYFRGKECIESLTSTESFSYAKQNGQISGWSTLRSIRALLPIARAKSAKLEKLLEEIHPQIAVVDSEYTIFPLLRRRIPVVAINTSEMVISRYLGAPGVAPAIRSHFWCVEFPDYLFHRHYCNFVLSPFPLRSPTRHRKFRRIGLIARRCVIEQARESAPKEFVSPREVSTAVFMLSGSVHASNIQFERHQIPFNVEVVGRSGRSSGKVTYHGRQMHNEELLARADVLVINGGYSAVSEAFVLRKPVFVVPVPGHAEQFVNACLVRDLGLGFVATETDVLDQLLGMYEQNRWVGLKPQQGAFEIDGAREAADAILSAIKARPPALEKMGLCNGR
jgi:UDP-N-acetylglucosamine:LPS N-acetylglucosamine transferase